MKNRLLLGAMLIGTASLFMACSDDNDSNPTLIQPTEFVLNTPAYVNEIIDLENTESVRLTWSQPKFTVDNAPINVTYEIQISPTNSFTVSAAEAEADEDGTVVADYAAIDKTSTTCYADLSAEDFAKALIMVTKWAEDAVPAEYKAYIRVNAFVLEGTTRLNSVVSNAIELNVNPYYIELKDAAPIMFYMVGDNILGWGNNPGVDCVPMFMQSGYAYDKTTGAGEIVYLNYFTTDGWKIQPSNFDWNYGFGGGTNEAVYANGTAGGNISCNPAGYYLITVNTGDNTCTIAKQDITPTVYDKKIRIAGGFNWDGIEMTPANNTGENHVWVYVLTVDEGSVEQIKFRTEDGSKWWGFGSTDGEINICGKAGDGANIGVPEGTWVIVFNDITGDFSIIAK